MYINFYRHYDVIMASDETKLVINHLQPALDKCKRQQGYDSNQQIININTLCAVVCCVKQPVFIMMSELF